MKSIEDLAKKNDSRLNKLLNQFQAMEGQMTSQWEKITLQMTAQANFEKWIEVRFEQLLKDLNDHFEKSKGKEVIGEISSVPADPNQAGTKEDSKLFRTEDRHESPIAPVTNKIPKVVFPSFDGNNPRSWIWKYKKNFQINSMLTSKRKSWLIWYEG